jgi:hypothetical protein
MIQINTISIKGLFICLLLSLAVQCCAATTVSITDATADPGDTVTISIMINSIDNYGTGTINIEYDPAVTHITDVTSSSDSSVTAKNIDNTIGLAKISAWNIDGVSGDIIFADVKINAVGNGGDSTPLTITVDTLQDTAYTEIPVDIISGSFTITGQASADPTPTQVPSTPSANDGETSTSQTLRDDGTDISPTSPPSVGEAHPASHDAETDSSPPTHPSGEDEAHSTPQSAATSTPKSPSSMMPGFEGALLAIGLLTAYLIARQR